MSEVTTKTSLHAGRSPRARYGAPLFAHMLSAAAAVLSVVTSAFPAHAEDDSLGLYVLPQVRFTYRLYRGDAPPALTHDLVVFPGAWVGTRFF